MTKQIKKLLFLTDTRIPSDRASAVHVRKLLPALSNVGIKVQLLSNKGTGMAWPGFTEKIDHFTIKLPGIKGGLYWMLWLFARRLKKYQHDAIYSRFVLFPLIADTSPYVIELHDDAWNKGFLFKAAISKAAKQKKCLGFTTITHAIKDDLLEAYPALNKRVVVIEDAAGLPNPEYQAVFNDQKYLNIAYVGSFHKGKGLDVVLQLAAKLPEHNFIIIGGNSSEVKLYNEVKTKNVEIKGFVDHDDIWKYMQHVDVCLLPNQPDVRTGKKSNIGKYTSPLKMFEYMSYSKPIIASDLEVLREVLDDDTAVFAAHDNIQAWVNAVNTLMSVSKREALGQSGHKKFIENYTWEKRAERILAFINEQLGKQ
ncbi:hypothetical protein AWW67_11215 [Roseivirga seohaensis]|uniref:Glycosyl transferase family 1 domain-containing protein n=1 Tax=Roseivirga seohaensis TaxID=1914963 RepID=A0A150XML2_9BACT|nr:glycosyltransferase family 4 protein [Roseivirga seohaensis]KYG79872.1 hypothetical protein AWW67_11215 [Roseivirga seohaensis]